MIYGDRVKLVITVLIRITIVVAIFGTIWTGQWLNLSLSLLTLFLTFLPAIIGRNFKLYLPLELEIVMIVFVYASIFLGGVHAYYTKIWWWDVVLHGSAGVLLGIFGFAAVYVLNDEKKIGLSMSPVFVAMFSFAFAMALGSIWEIVEFALDSFFGFNMQGVGIVDTMSDLIIDMVGALLASGAGYLYMRKGDFDFLGRLVRKIEKS